MAALLRYHVLDSSPEQPFDKITALVQSVFNVPICAVSLIDYERQWFKSIQGLEIQETTRSVSFCTKTIQTDQPLIVPDAREDFRFSSNPLVCGEPHLRSYAGVPLRTPDGYNVGALCALDRVPRVYRDEQIEILKGFASLVVHELELRLVAGKDHLTGALTRLGFVKQLEKAIGLFERHRRESVLVMIDIDHFKAVNDSFGHPTGDQVLKAVAKVCCEQLRESDSMGRLGGEEFGVLLADTDQGGGLHAAEKIRIALEELIADPRNGIKVTASFGLASLAEGISKPQDWIAEADEALYAAKRQGRNRCVLAGHLPNTIAA